MSRPQTLILTGFALLGAVVVWQFRRISEMERTTAALLARDTAAAAAATGSSSSPAADGAGGSKDMTGRPPGPPGGQPGVSPDRKPRNPERDAKFRASRASERKQLQDAKILALTTKLKLTPDQQTVIRAALDKSSADRDALREAGAARREAGRGDNSEEARRAGMAKFAAVDAAQEQAIAASLSAEQLAAYTDYKTEQKQNTIEGWANRQLGDLLGNFSLTEDQKDAAFQVFARQAQDSPFDPDRVTAVGGDIKSLAEQGQKNELESMRRILTPEQYKIYKPLQEQRWANFRNMLPGTGPRSGPGSGPGPGGGPDAPPPPDQPPGS